MGNERGPAKPGAELRILCMAYAKRRWPAQDDGFNGHLREAFYEACELFAPVVEALGIYEDHESYENWDELMRAKRELRQKLEGNPPPQKEGE